jgi:hypothetical protein
MLRLMWAFSETLSNSVAFSESFILALINCSRSLSFSASWGCSAYRCTNNAYFIRTRMSFLFSEAPLWTVQRSKNVFLKASLLGVLVGFFVIIKEKN